MSGQFIETLSTNFFLIASGPFKYSSSNIITILIPLLFSTSLYLVITSVPISFVYRYTIIVGNKLWTMKIFYLAILINIVIVMPINVFGYQAFVTESPKYDSNLILLDKRIWFNKEINKYRLFVMANKKNIYYKLMISYIFIVICAVYIVIIFSSYAVKRKLKKASRINTWNRIQKLNNINHQINNILFIQALIPLIFILIPYSFWLICIILKVRFLNIFSPLLWIHISWIPTVEAIATIFLVKEFRKGIAKFWKINIYSEITRISR
ncbi:7TM GPCR, serpentine receptor class r (Str) family-containing protein [Strongyloides ratti]|uniref:7TM GPCR, serpentine receptor class r (Str) family-containing protein n=1 Tax=Strongyloides ratti TaxID=34506 RepID=A0A090LL38_STRRB|nr:7TM GPCR, serpentine receptor class r (Str) family-containing protein [Strongyloides ratti]CEF70430.1 7TM GPCR, serpentine receptor class r (Str) family-containing protein [Strongyloides ratti]